MNKVMTHWFNGRSIEWIANKEGLAVERVVAIINESWEAA